MAIQRETRMKDLIVLFEEGHTYRFKGLNLDPTLNKDRDAHDQIGGFDFEDVITHEVITLYPNQFFSQISIVERDGDCVKLVKRCPKYSGGFVEFFKKVRSETTTYGELADRLVGHVFKCGKVWAHTEPLKGFNPISRKMSNLWADANLGGFMSVWLGYDSDDLSSVKDPVL